MRPTEPVIDRSDHFKDVQASPQLSSVVILNKLRFLKVFVLFLPHFIKLALLLLGYFIKELLYVLVLYAEVFLGRLLLIDALLNCLLGYSEAHILEVDDRVALKAVDWQRKLNQKLHDCVMRQDQPLVFIVDEFCLHINCLLV